LLISDFRFDSDYNSPVLSEIHRRDALTSGDPDAASEGDRDARVEQLLLLGLDHYFAAEYEQAINVWTRALFVDRNHPRARAYIERARGALAERQRQSEELLHSGVAALERGDGTEARRLLQAAIEGGAPPDEVHAVLARLNRAGIGAGEDVAAIPDVVARPRGTPGDKRQTRGARHEIATAPRAGRVRRVAIGFVVTGLVVGLGYAIVTGRLDWQSAWTLLSFSEPAPAPGVPIAQDLSLPLPRRGEIALGRARALAASGRLHDALAALDQVRATDTQKDEADRLRADLQRQLIALEPMPPLPAQPAPPRTPTRDRAAPERRVR